MSAAATLSITDAVRRLYETFPYPHYPLLAKPFWQDGYLGSSWFAASLFEDTCGQISAIHNGQGHYLKRGRCILLAGSGEIQPYVLRQFEPAHHRLLCVDLSAKSLRRARWRLLLTRKKTEFVCNDLHAYLRGQGAVTGPYSHIDAYGVIHHLGQPGAVLNLLASHLRPGGTMRLMLYNRAARSWIHHIQAAFRSMKFDPYETSDRELARQMLNHLGEESEFLKTRLRPMRSSVKCDARLVDTFFHVREVRQDIAKWFDLIERCGLMIYGLFDRYGELDDLDNPLWQPPSKEDLVERAADLRFENNLEIYLSLRNRTAKPSRYSKEQSIRPRHLWRYLLRRPPHLWFSFDETKNIPRRLRRQLWHEFMHYTTRTEQGSNLDHLRLKLDFTAMQRLARLGAILPGQVEDPNLRRILRQPMCPTSVPPKIPEHSALQDDVTLQNMVKRALNSRGIHTPRRFNLVMQRFDRAQAYLLPELAQPVANAEHPTEMQSQNKLIE